MTFKSSAGLALQMALMVLIAVRSGAQLLTAPPAPPPGSTGNSLVIDGNVDIDHLTLNVNFFPGNGIGVTATSGTASLTNTTINLGSSGGVKGIVANGPGATLALGAGSSVNASRGGGGNGIRAGDNNTAGTVNLNGIAVTVLGSGGNSSGVWANISGSNATLVDTSVTVSGPGGGNFGVKATSGARVNMTGGSVLVDATGGNNIGVLAGMSGSPGSTAMLNSTSMTVSDSNSSIGVQADGANSVLRGADSTITRPGSCGQSCPFGCNKQPDQRAGISQQSGRRRNLQV
jgi:hypothetical protein